MPDEALIAPAECRMIVRESEAEQAQGRDVEATADHGAKRSGARERGVDRGRAQERLAEEERREGDDLGDDDGEHREDENLCEQDASAVRRGREHGAHGARAVLRAHDEHAEHADGELRDEHADRGSAKSGSKPWMLWGDMVDQLARVSAVAMALTPRPSTTVMTSVHIVERTVRNFVHSERARSIRL